MHAADDTHMRYFLSLFIFVIVACSSPQKNGSNFVEQQGVPSDGGGAGGGDDSEIEAIGCQSELPAGAEAIATEEDLDKVRDNLSGSFALVADLDFSNLGSFEPIAGPFVGTLYGNGCSILNLKIHKPGVNDVGFFEHGGDGAVVSKLIFENLEVIGNGRVGGLFGRLDQSGQIGVLIERVMLTGSIEASASYAGGIVGRVYSGLNLTIENSSVAGSVVSSSTNVGGLIGGLNSPMDMVNVYSIASIEGGQRTGGLIGRVEANGDGSLIKNSFVAGPVTGNPASSGGLIGSFKSSTADVQNVYWDVEATGQTSSADGLGFGKTTNEMLQQITYQGFDFFSVWDINDGSSYPWLQWEE